MQVNSVDARSSISAQNVLLQKENADALSYQVKLNGDNRDAVIEKTAEGYRAYVAGITGISVNGASQMAAEISLSAKLVDFQA